MNSLDKQYQALLQDIMDNGVKKEDRTGTGTLSVFGRQIRHKMSEGFPLLTTKKMAYKSVFTELVWFIMGGTNIKWLLENGNTIWVGDAYKNYLKYHALDADYYTKEEFIEKIKTDDEFAKKWGELGLVYGKQWRDWSGEIDQIENLINELKNNPDSRRMMVSAWNVGDLNQMVLPPCHYGFQVWTRELSIHERANIYFKKHPDWTMMSTHKFFDGHHIPKRAISLMWNQRSVDTFLGLPFNIASYGALLVMLADELGMVPDELIGNLGDTHLYLNHIEQAKEQISREPFPLPTLTVKDGMYCRHVDNFYLDVDNFYLENYQSHPAIKAPLSN